MNSIRYASGTRIHACNALPNSSRGISESVFDFQDEDEKARSSRPCICADCLRRVLATRNLASDLGDHMFGHLVSTELARDIFTSFIADGFVQVFEVHGVSQALIDPHADDTQNAIQQAFEAAAAHGCIRPYVVANPLEGRSPSAGQEEVKKGKTYLFKWCAFPREPFNRDELVSFLNEVTDRGFKITKSRFPATKLELRHRFATSEHALLLAYGLGPKDIPPNFFLLPIEAFSDAGLTTVDERYLNFSAFRLVGGSHEKFPRVGLEQMEDYAECLKCAQPWVYYVLGMMFSQNLVVLSRGDGSDWEHLPLVPWDGRGSIELIRILLGLVLADAVDLGQNPHIELVSDLRVCHLDTSPRSAPASAVSSIAEPHVDADDSDDFAPTSCHSAPSTIPHKKPAEKRHHSEIEKGNEDEELPRMKKRKIIEIDSGAANLATFSSTDSEG